jgi:taurine dioxygenase
MSMSELKITPHQGSFGADVEGIDLTTPLSDDQVAAIRAAWDENLVLRIRNQSLTDSQLVAFSARLGTLDKAPPAAHTNQKSPEAKYIITISNVIENGTPIGVLGNGEAFWHADMTYMDKPPSGSILYSLEVPDDGGDTQFANMYRAYETLPRDLAEAIEGKVCIHDASLTSAGTLRPGYEHVESPDKAVGARHLLAMNHPGTGRKHLFLGRRNNAYIVGMDVEESERILDALWAHATKPEFTWTQHWKVGDIVMWDNIATLHRRESFSQDARRVMHRTQIGEAYRQERLSA